MWSLEAREVFVRQKCRGSRNHFPLHVAAVCCIVSPSSPVLEPYPQHLGMGGVELDLKEAVRLKGGHRGGSQSYRASIFVSRGGEDTDTQRGPVA